MCIILRKCRYVVKSFKPFQIVEFADIAIDGGVVTCIGNCAHLQKCCELECDNSIAVPGFVSMHTHALPEKNSAGYSVEVVRRVLDILVRYGYTATHIVDIDDAIIDDACKAAEEIGVRISIGPTISNSKDLKKLSYLKLFKRSPFCFPSVNVSSVEDLDTSVLTAVKEFTSAYSPPLHIHITSSENLSKTLAFYRKTGSWPIIVLDSLGLLTEKTCIAHASWITTWEIERISERGSCVILTPFADAVRGVHGVVHPTLFSIGRLCLGIDNPWHRPSPSLLFDIVALQAIYSNRTWRAYPDTLQIFHYSTTLGSKTIGGTPGIIEIGKKADIAVLRANQDALDKSISGFILRGLAQYAKYTIVDGKLVWRHQYA
jgi:cytosine/adenosine deaminase-related metal-dependent hydrolase